MEDFYKVLSNAGHAWNVGYSGRQSFDVTEFWKSDATGAIAIDNRIIGPDPQQRREWLTQQRRDGQSLVLRLVCLSVDVGLRKVDISEPVEKELLDQFGLGLAHSYFKTFTSGVTALPKTITDEFERQAFAFCFAPKLASLWSHTQYNGLSPDEARVVTEGIVFIKKTSKPNKQPAVSKPPSFQKILSKLPWDPQICRAPAAPALMLSILLGQEIQQAQTSILLEIRGIEARTGHHDFHDRNQAAPEELSVLSAKASGHATRLASVSRKTAMLAELLAFLRSTEQATRGGASVPGRAESSPLQQHVHVLESRLKMQKLETDFILKRVEVQLQAVFHLIAQNDNLSNLRVSAASHMIASYSYRDSSSMKTLAIVTMLFLPGSFVSALFSTDFFAWDEVDRNNSDIGVPMTPQMGLYWVITVPLTVVTFALYFLWLGMQKAKKEKEMASWNAAADSQTTSSDSRASTLLPTLRHGDSITIGKNMKLQTRSSSLSYYNQPAEV